MKKEHKHGLSGIVDEMQHLLTNIVTDLEKATKGNKAASQRVRTGTVKLEKVAKSYRKESILSEKSQTKGKAKARKAAPASKSKAAVKAKAPAKAHAKKAPAKAPTKVAAKGNAKAHKATVKAKGFTVKRPTAKLPARSR